LHRIRITTLETALSNAKDYIFVRYDARGNGLSDWDVQELSLDAWVRHMEAVADTARLGRFPLVGSSQGCTVSIAYAVRHPERVSHLIQKSKPRNGAREIFATTAAEITRGIVSVANRVGLRWQKTTQNGHKDV
jgi:pimeloyl-ACP methyl ester carboxylesterase